MTIWKEATYSVGALVPKTALEGEHNDGAPKLGQRDVPGDAKATVLGRINECAV